MKGILGNDADTRITSLLWVITCILVILYGVQKIICFDIWWHLKTGEWIFKNYTIPYKDFFSYTFAGRDWIDFEWLFQIIIYPIYHIAGLPGLIVFKTCIIAVLIFFLFKHTNLLSGRKGWIAAFIVIVCLNVIKPRFMVRPQIVFLLFLCLYSYILNLYFIKGKNYLYVLPILHILWVNIHGSFLLGIGLMLIYTSSHFASLSWSHRNDMKPVFKDRTLRILAISTLLLLLASFVSPYGYKTFTVPFATAMEQEAKKYIAEWISLSPRSLLIFLPDFTIWFKGLFIVGIFSFFLRKENLKKVEHFLIFALFSYMAFSHHRFIAAWGIVIGPIIAFNLSQILPLSDYRKRIVHYMKWGPAFIVACLSFYIILFTGEYRRIGLGLTEGNYPSGTVKFIKDHELRGNIFNQYGYGGFLIWHLYPQLRVFVDGRTPTVYDQDFFWSYRQALNNEKIWKRLVEEYHIDMVHLKDNRMNGYMMFSKHLDDDQDWILVAFDEVSTLYLKNVPKFNDIIKKYGYHYFRPSDLNMDYVKQQQGDKQLFSKLVEELKEAKNKDNGSPFYINYALGSVYLLWDDQKHLEKALDSSREALKIEPNSPLVLYNVAITLLKMKQYDEGIKELKKVVKINPSFPESYYQLGFAHYKKENYDCAINYLEKYKELKGEEVGADAYEYLGLSYLKTFQLQKAASCFLRETYLSEPAFQLYQNLGITFCGLREYEKACKYFQEALTLKPNDIKLLYDLGICYERLKEREKASTIFKTLITLPAQTKEEKDLIEGAMRKLQGKE